MADFASKLRENPETAVNRSLLAYGFGYDIRIRSIETCAVRYAPPSARCSAENSASHCLLIVARKQAPAVRHPANGKPSAGNHSGFSPRLLLPPAACRLTTALPIVVASELVKQSGTSQAAASFMMDGLTENPQQRSPQSSSQCRLAYSHNTLCVVQVCGCALLPDAGTWSTLVKATRPPAGRAIARYSQAPLAARVDDWHHIPADSNRRRHPAVDRLALDETSTGHEQCRSTPSATARHRVAVIGAARRGHHLDIKANDHAVAAKIGVVGDARRAKERLALQTRHRTGPYRISNIAYDDHRPTSLSRK